MLDADVDEYRAARDAAVTLHGRRDDGRRGRAAAARRHGLLRRHRAPEPGREPRPADARAAAACSSTRAARSARSRRSCRSRSATASWPRPPTRSSRCPRCSPTGCRAGRIDVGFLGAAQIDRHGNLNSTVIGDYEHPKVRLPGGGGAPEIATSVARRVRDAAPVAARVRRAARLQHDGRRRASAWSSPTSACSSPPRRAS